MGIVGGSVSDLVVGQTDQLGGRTGSWSALIASKGPALMTTLGTKIHIPPAVWAAGTPHPLIRGNRMGAACPGSQNTFHRCHPGPILLSLGNEKRWFEFKWDLNRRLPS